VPDLKVHPLKRMLDLGLKATVNSDDPSFFGGYVGENYRRIAAALGLTANEITTLARNGFAGSFLPDADKARHLVAIDAAAAAHA
jgi:adenine deaminase